MLKIATYLPGEIHRPSYCSLLMRYLTNIYRRTCPILCEIDSHHTYKRYLTTLFLYVSKFQICVSYVHFGDVSDNFQFVKLCLSKFLIGVITDCVFLLASS
jgi:hypothetical protein